MVASRDDHLGEQTDELALLARFVRAGQRMDEAEDLDELWTVVAAEAARALGVSARVMQWTGQHWAVLDHHPEESDHSESVTTRAPADPADGPDQNLMDDAMTFPRPGPASGHARSVLVTDLECSELRAPTRLVWTSSERDAFATTAELAAEYARFTSSAVRRTHARIHLQRAVTARHRVGQAQGIVMARFGLAAADAFDLLIRRSQNTNVKLSVLADHVIHSSELEVGAVPSPRPAGDADAVPDVTSLDDTAELGEVSDRTSTQLLRVVDDPAADSGVIAPELADAITESIVTGTGDAAGRAEVMCALVEEMRASVAWLNAAGTREELRSLQPAVTAVREHLHRMLRLTGAETS